MKKTNELQGNFQKELKEITSSLSVHHPLEKISARSIISIFQLKKPKLYKYHDTQQARNLQMKNIRVQTRKNDILKYKFISQEFQKMFNTQIKPQITTNSLDYESLNTQTCEVMKIPTRKQINIRSLSPVFMIASQEQVLDQITRKTFTLAQEVQNDLKKAQIITNNNQKSKLYTSHSQHSDRLQTEIRYQTLSPAFTNRKDQQPKCTTIDIKIKNQQNLEQKRWSAGYIQKLQVKADKIVENTAKVHEQNKNNYRKQIALFQRYKNTDC